MLNKKRINILIPLTPSYWGKIFFNSMDGEGGGEIGHVLFDLLLSQKLFLVETLGIFHEAVLKRDIL